MAIVLVDDDAVMLTLTETFLKRKGYAVAKAQSAAAVFEMLETLTPDLMILDIMMPGTNGIELCHQLRSRAQTRQTPIIILSARNDMETIDACFHAGANAYLTKADVPKLSTVVGELLNSNPNSPWQRV
jgi:CheY-like chemotaxis protein